MPIIAEIVLQCRLLKASKGESTNDCKLQCHAQARTDTKRFSAKTDEW